MGDAGGGRRGWRGGDRGQDGCGRPVAAAVGDGDVRAEAVCPFWDFSPDLADRRPDRVAHGGDGLAGRRFPTDGLRRDRGPVEAHLEPRNPCQAHPGRVHDRRHVPIRDVVGEAQALHRQVQPRVRHEVQPRHTRQDPAVVGGDAVDLRCVLERQMPRQEPGPEPPPGTPPPVIGHALNVSHAQRSKQPPTGSARGRDAGQGALSRCPRAGDARGLGCLPGLGPARRDLPAPRVGDEPVPPQQQEPAPLVGDDEPRRRPRHRQDVVLHAADARHLDIVQPHVHLVAAVCQASSMAHPAHQQGPLGQPPDATLSRPTRALASPLRCQCAARTARALSVVGIHGSRGGPQRPARATP